MSKVRMKSSTSVAALLIVALVVVTSALLGIFGARNYSTNKLRLSDNLSGELRTYADLSATSLSLAVWNLDRGQIDQIADGIMKNNSISGVSIQAAGRVHARSRDKDWNVITNEAPLRDDGKLVETRSVSFGDEMIGTVTILGTTKFLDEELAALRNSSIATILLLELVLIASLYFLFWRMVLRPLKTIQLYAAATMDDNKPKVSLHEALFTGELEDLRLSLSAMTALLDHRYQELQLAHDKLQQELDYRTKMLKEKMLLEERLAQGQKLESLGKLAGGIAHDFNNMLSIILGYGEALVTKIPKDSALHKDLNAIMRAAEKAADITRQLLAFSRKQVMEVKVIDLNQLVLGLKKMIGRLLGDDIEVIIIPVAASAFVTADPSQLEQALINLCINARDAMPNGGTLAIENNVVILDGHISETGQQINAGEYVLVNISDTGTGMDEDTRKRIFEPFFTTKAPGKGTGLGLSSVDGVVKQLGGEISVYSQLGHGTTFKLFLPRVKKPEAGTRNEPPITVSKGNGQTILVLEDEEGLRKIVCQMLSNLGYCPLEAANAREAIELASNHARLDLMLTDIVMPEKNGREVFEEVEKIVPGLKVLYMSGYPQSVISSKGILDAGIEFIPKPFSENILGKKLQEVLQP